MHRYKGKFGSGGSFSTDDPKIFEDIQRIDRNMSEQRRLWIEQIREAGAKASHPDDGWVDRTNNIVQFAYPHFNDDPQVGDMIVLGSPPHSDKIQHRFVRVTEIRQGGFFTPVTYYSFEGMS